LFGQKLGGILGLPAKTGGGWIKPRFTTWEKFATGESWSVGPAYAKAY